MEITVEQYQSLVAEEAAAASASRNYSPTFKESSEALRLAQERVKQLEEHGEGEGDYAALLVARETAERSRFAHRGVQRRHEELRQAHRTAQQALQEAEREVKALPGYLETAKKKHIQAAVALSAREDELNSIQRKVASAQAFF
ncbi:MAG: hypothetical protein HC884_00890 [Chloroflexaceae bacterium]|nr:hypothetical protein [Chloroflexaceae bacterium]